jgi:hypothetical protein
MSDNPFEQPLQSEMPQTDPGGNPFDKPFTNEPAQQTAPTAPQGVIGAATGFYNNTLGPLVNLAKGVANYESTPTDPQLGRQQEDFKTNAYKEAGQHLKNGDFAGAAGSLLGLLGNAPTDKADPITNLVGNLIDAHKQEAQKTIAAYKSGRYSEAAGHGLASVIPAIGPAAAKAGEDIGAGNTALGLGEGAGLLASVAAPSAVSKVVGKAADVLTPEATDIAGESIPTRSKVLDVLGGTEAQDAFDRTAQNPKGRQAIANVAADAAGSETAGTPSVEDPLGIRQAAQAPKLRAKAGWNKVDELTNGAFSDAQQAAEDASDDFTAAGKQQYRQANAKVEALIDAHASELPEGTTAQSLKTDYRNYIGTTKIAKSLDTAFEPTPGVSDGGYVDATRLRAKIADLQQSGTWKQAGYTANHVSTIDQIAVRLQQASERTRISKVAMGVAADAGIHLLGAGATAKIGVPLAATRWLFGKVLTNPNVAGTLLQGLKAAHDPAVITSNVARAVSASGAAKPTPVPTLKTALSGSN